MQHEGIRARGNHRLAIIGMALLLGQSASALAQDQPAFTTTPLSPTVSMITGSGGNVAVSAGADGVYVIDDQVKPVADSLLAQIRTISEQPIRFVINTHYHGDHVGGNETLADTGAVILAHDNVRQRISTEQFSEFFNATTEPWPAGALPVVTFSESITLHLNGEPATVRHVPRGHTDGDAIVYFPVSNVIHMGDIFFHGLYPFIDLDGGGSAQGLVAAVEHALQMINDDTQVIPGHGALATTADLRAYRDFLTAAIDQVRPLVDQGKTLEEAIEARPTAAWDDALGKTWITPAQFVTFIYNSLKDVPTFTRNALNSAASTD